jgi:hypothetical protein
MPRFSLAHDPLLDPPPHVLAEVDEAWERAQDLIAGELELHFLLSSGAERRRVAGELRLADGAAVARLSATEALLLACGDALVCDERPHALAA